MKKHEIVIDAKLEFEVEAEHEVVALTKSLVWLCEALEAHGESPLVQVGFNLGQKEEVK